VAAETCTQWHRELAAALSAAPQCVTLSHWAHPAVLPCPGEGTKRAHHLWRLMYQDGKWSRTFSDAPEPHRLSLAAQAKLSSCASLSGGLTLQSVHTARDGTHKLVFALGGVEGGPSGSVETVLIPMYNRWARRRGYGCLLKWHSAGLYGMVVVVGGADGGSSSSAAVAVSSSNRMFSAVYGRQAVSVPAAAVHPFTGLVEAVVGVHGAAWVAHQAPCIHLCHALLALPPEASSPGRHWCAL
jgi:hypothetical protein